MGTKYTEQISSSFFWYRACVSKACGTVLFGAKTIASAAEKYK